ncbi:MAG: class I SAM-dependent methyltransferase [Actinomycetota bacterium]|nr:class I SAM-dependent methyltransferase [Actinomycetota bacterium]
MHNRVLYRVMEDALEYAAGRYASGRLVDIGCGSKPWRELFAGHVVEHVGVDHAETIRGVRVDVVATAYEIPLADGVADTLLLSAVLEHLERPADALEEASRLLKDGGHAILTAPFIWPIHERPRDFFRYSPYGLRFLLEEAGFEVVEILPLAGAWTTFSLELSYALRKYRRRALAPVVETAMRTVQWAGARWDRVDYQPQFSWSHLAIARKPDGGGSARPPGRPPGRSRA